MLHSGPHEHISLKLQRRQHLLQRIIVTEYNIIYFPYFYINVIHAFDATKFLGRDSSKSLSMIQETCSNDNFFCPVVFSTDLRHYFILIFRIIIYKPADLLFGIVYNVTHSFTLISWMEHKSDWYVVAL